ncbi:MAG TPA: quinone-dependent dihydroorotate dehydrogenase [Propionicimonas sp.]
MGLPAALLDAGYSRLVRPVLFRSFKGDPEAVHEWMIHTLAGVGSTAPALAVARLIAGSSGRATTVAGIRFGSRVGLAAGLDKDATAVLAWAGLGFGFAELGTVTGRPQPGNDRPRMFRLRDSKALINRMGFNNPGAAAVAATLAARNVYRGNGAAGIPIGISIGKTKIVELEDAVEDYLTSLRLLAPHADYVAVNVSSPNTPGLRSLQDAGALGELLTALVAQAAEVQPAIPEERLRAARRDALAAGSESSSGTATSNATRGAPLPIFVKVAPDLTDGQLDEVLATSESSGAAGLIATTTTLARDGLAASDVARAAEAGGLSGAPLTVRARQVVARLAARTSLPVIGSGGIMTPADATAMFDAGAELVQLYTGFIYGGPGLAAAINALDTGRLGS